MKIKKKYIENLELNVGNNTLAYKAFNIPRVHFTWARVMHTIISDEFWNFQFYWPSMSDCMVVSYEDVWDVT